LNAEAQQLKAEIDRVSEQTSFNGTKLLDGTFTDQAFQVGANQGETITVSGITDASSAALGTWTSASTTTYTQTTASATATAFATGVSLDVNGVTISTAAGAADAAAAATALKSAFDTAKANPANTSLANVTMAADGKITSTDKNLTLSNATNVSGVTAGTTAGTATTVAGTAQTGFASLDISTVDGADAAMLAMDGALNAINTARANMGAVQNRFSSVVANLGSTSENLSAARSRIQDADFAAETAKLTRNQILQQAGTAMLAQANQAPQGVLSLLR
ncbi:MAG TPA: flagellin, partial [Lysobacter sp.]